MKVIKRYANRKLYDTESSSYVTLEEIAQMVKQGVEFSILDNRSKRDITSLTLAQILCEEEKKQSHGLPLQALRGLIRTGEDFFQRKVRAPLHEMRDRTQETVERIIGRSGEGGAGESEEAVAPPAETEVDLRPVLKDLFEHLQRTLDDSLRTVDEQVRRVLDGMTHLPEMQSEIASLRALLAGLEARVMELEAELADPARSQPDEEPAAAAVGEQSEAAVGEEPGAKVELPGA